MEHRNSYRYALVRSRPRTVRDRQDGRTDDAIENEADSRLPTAKAREWAHVAAKRYRAPDPYPLHAARNNALRMR